MSGPVVRRHDQDVPSYRCTGKYRSYPALPALNLDPWQASVHGLSVRAAVADVERFQDETDPGTRIFIKQLVEMHTASLRQESQNMRVMSDLCNTLESLVSAPAGPNASGETP